MMLNRRHLQWLCTVVVLAACISLLTGQSASDFRPIATRISYAWTHAGSKASWYRETLLDWMPDVAWPDYRQSAKPDLLAANEHGNRLVFAVADATTFHEEVFGPVVYSLMVRQEQSVLPVLFRSRFRFGYKGDILAPLLPVNTIFHKTSQLNAWLQHVNVLVLTSGDFDLECTRRAIRRHRHLHIVLVVHHANDWSLARPGPRLSYSSIALLHNLARARRLSLLTLSSHVGLALAETLRVDAPDVPWSSIIDTFVPIIPIQRPIFQQDQAGLFNKIAVQGQIVTSRRGYKQLFDEILAAIDADPAEWGYRRDLEFADAPFLPASSVIGPSNTFELHLIGALQATDQPVIPPALANVIKLHPNLDFRAFYETLSSMDMLLPALRQGSDGQPSECLINRASSSIPAAIIARIPALVTEEQARAYDYLAGPAIIPMGNGQKPINAIRQMRQQARNLTWAGIHSVSEWEGYEEDLQARNDRVWQRIIERVRTRPPPKGFK